MRTALFLGLVLISVEIRRSNGSDPMHRNVDRFIMWTLFMCVLMDAVEFIVKVL